MAVEIPFGQYISTGSWLHSLDARSKMAMLAAYVFGLFAFSSWPAMLLLGALLALAYASAKLPARLALKALKPLSAVLLFVLLVNGITFRAGSVEGALSLIGSFGVKPAGLLLGLLYALRVCLLIMALSLLTFSTSTVALSDGLCALLRPLRRLAVPVDDLATMLLITLRFIPLSAEEIAYVMEAQRARGARFGQGSLLTRLRAYLPLLLPVFVGLFRRADELAMAMEARCYTGRGRSRLNAAILQRLDWICLGISALFCIGCIVLLIVM